MKRFVTVGRCNQLSHGAHILHIFLDDHNQQREMREKVYSMSMIHEVHAAGIFMIDGNLCR
jgi:hypothetical protein